MKTKTFIIALLCFMLVSLQGAMLVNAKMGSITFHVFKDYNKNGIQDANEHSPPITIVKLKTQGDSPFFWFMANRVRLVGFSGDATYRFVTYPCDYLLVAHYEYILPAGIGLEIWHYGDFLHLDETNIGSKLYVPLNGTYVP